MSGSPFDFDYQDRPPHATPRITVPPGPATATGPQDPPTDPASTPRHIGMGGPPLALLGACAGILKALRGKPVRTASIRLTSETDVPLPPRFVLVHRPDRLPLSIDDGSPLAVRPAQDKDAEPAFWFSPSTLVRTGDTSVDRGLVRGTSSDPWTADVTECTGYLRLFVDRTGDALPENAREALAHVALCEATADSVRLR